MRNILNLVNLVQDYIWFFSPVNYVFWFLSKVADVFTYQFIVFPSKCCINMLCTIEADWFVMCNAISELPDMSKVFINLCLIQAFLFIGEDAQECFSSSFVPLLGE